MARRQLTMYIDDIDILQFDIKVIDYEIPSYPKRKNTGVNIPGAHGTKLVPSTLASSTLIANVVCSGNTPESVNTKIREFFAFMYTTSDPHKIVFSDDDTVVRYAILDAPESYRVMSGVDNAMAELVLTFFMADPFTYNADASSISEDTPSGVSLIIPNESFECPAVFTIRNLGNKGVSEITFSVNGEVARFLCELRTGDTLVMDTENYEVYYNGTPRLDYWQGEMPVLQSGNNVIVQQNKQNASLSVSVQFTKRWV